MRARVVLTGSVARLAVAAAVAVGCVAAAASVGPGSRSASVAASSSASSSASEVSFGSTSAATSWSASMSAASRAVGAIPPVGAHPARAPSHGLDSARTRRQRAGRLPSDVASRAPSSHHGVVPAALPRAGPRWAWPIAPKPEVLRPFRAPASAWGPGHRGLDLAVSAGGDVLAVEGGVVTHAAVVAGRGTVSVRHPDGLVSTYEPVHAQVTPGQEVGGGDVLGKVARDSASSHCGSQVCLHLGARRGSGYLDPWPLLAGGRLALLPLARVPP